ncbi:MAG: hypothetical protein HZA08_13490 [Nitrospirae bacterium]|nr:hypothetical protein [Nitrospirota bacterium]
MGELFTKGHEKQRDKNVPPILNLFLYSRGFLTSNSVRYCSFRHASIYSWIGGVF